MSTHGCAEGTALRPLIFDTAAFPLRERKEAWRAHHAFWMDVTPLEEEPGAFHARSELWVLGPLVMGWNRASAARNVRGPGRVRGDQMDHYTLIQWRNGTMQGRMGVRDFVGRGVAPSVFGLHLPMEADRTAAEWLMAFLPRDWVAEVTGGLDARIGHTLDTPMGRLLGAHLNQMAQELPHLSASELPAASEATRLLLRAAAQPAGDALAEARPVIEATQRSRLRRLIRHEIGSARLTPSRLAQLSGISRSRLYRMFEAEGGVAKVILAERLRMVRRSLSDPLEQRPIARIAEAAGMPDPSAFGRAFRRETGLSPGAFREAVQAGGTVPLAAKPADDFRAALAGLSA